MNLLRVDLHLPLLGKELTELAARKRTYVVRVVYAVLLFGCFFWYYISMDPTIGPGSEEHARRGLGKGHEFLVYLMTLQLAGIYLFLPAMMAGAITEEKERDTLSLLFLTRLGPWTIVFEKLLGRLVPMLTFLLLALPLMAIAYSFGGVTRADFAGMIYTLVLTCFRIGAIAILMSTLWQTTVGALLSTYVLSAVFFFRGEASTAGSVLTILLCLYLARSFLEARARARPRRFGLTLLEHLDRIMRGINEIFGGVVLVKGRGALPRRDPITWRSVYKSALGKPEHFVRALLLIEMPIVMVITYALASQYSFTYHGYSYRHPAEFTSLSTTIGILWVLAAVALVLSGVATIAGERSRQTLDVLLATPLRGRDILTQKYRGLTRLRLLLAIALGTVFAAECLAEWPYSSDSALGFRFFCGVLWLGMLAVYLPLLSWLAIWFGLLFRSQNRAVLAAIGYLLAWNLLPLVLERWIGLGSAGRSAGGSLPVLAALSPAGALRYLEYPGFWRSLMPAIGIIINLVVAVAFVRLLRAHCLRNADRLLGRVPEPERKRERESIAMRAPVRWKWWV